MTPLRRLRRAAPFLATLAVRVAASGAAVAANPFAAVFPEGANACWGRVYDDAHLAKHPRQTVRAIHLADPWGKRPHLEIPDGLDYHDPGGDRLAEGRMTAELLVERVDGTGVWEAKVDCTVDKGRLRCIRDEDDPKVATKPLEAVTRDGALLVTLNPPGLDLARFPDRAAIDRPPREMRLAPGDDDRSFRLDRLPAEVCRDRHLAGAPDYARDGGPPLRAAILTALHRADTPTGFRRAAARMCLAGRAADGAPVRVGLDPGLVDSMVGIDTVPMKAARGEGAARRVFDLSCRARAWKWDCVWTPPETPTDLVPEQRSAPLIRRKGGALLLAMPCLQGDCAATVPPETATVPPLSLDLVATERCPADLFVD